MTIEDLIPTLERGTPEQFVELFEEWYKNRQRLWSVTTKDARYIVRARHESDALQAAGCNTNSNGRTALNVFEIDIDDVNPMLMGTNVIEKVMLDD